MRVDLTLLLLQLSPPPDRTMPLQAPQLQPRTGAAKAARRMWPSTVVRWQGSSSIACALLLAVLLVCICAVSSAVHAASILSQSTLQPAESAAPVQPAAASSDAGWVDSPAVPSRFQDDDSDLASTSPSSSSVDPSSLSAEELSGASVLSASSFIPPVPRFPLRFRAKARFLVGATSKSNALNAEDEDGGEEREESIYERATRSMSITPSLMLLHFDGISQRIREDFYALVGGMHRRFFSGVRDFASQREWLVYHKQRKSPRACFEVPFSGTVSALFSSPGFAAVTPDWITPSSLQNWAASLEYQGLATVQLIAGSEAEGERRPATNMTLLHYKTPNAILDRGATVAAEKGARTPPPLLASAAPPVHVYLHPLTHQPLVVSSPHVRIDILSFQALDDELAVQGMQAVFDVNRASKAKCLPFTPEKK